MGGLLLWIRQGMFLGISVWSFIVTRVTVTVTVKGGERRGVLSLPGDATYGIELLDKEEPDGTNDDPMRTLQTLKTIKQFARDSEVVVLPSHDVNTPRFLAERVPYRPV